MRHIYQPVATGRKDWCDGTFTTLSKRVFPTREEAEAYKPEFSRAVTERRPDRPLAELSEEGLRVYVAELDLAEPGEPEGASK